MNNAVCSEAAAQTDERPHPPTISSGRRNSATSVPPAATLPPPHLICPKLTGRTPAHTHISRPSLLFRLTLSLWPLPSSGLRGPAATLRLAAVLWWFKEECATKREDEMEERSDQYSHCLSQGGDEPLGRSARWMQTWGERAGPERPSEVRCRPPRWKGLVERSHGESTRSGWQPTGNPPPASTPCTTGQRTNPEGFSPRKGCHARQQSGTMAETGHLVYPVSVRDTAERGMG
jgi:hypothetical protein